MPRRQRWSAMRSSATFKIIEIRYHDGLKRRNGLQQFCGVSASADDDPELKQFLAVCGSKAPEEYIYTACRLAVAHASIKRPSTPTTWKKSADYTQRPMSCACWRSHDLAGAWGVG